MTEIRQPGKSRWSSEHMEAFKVTPHRIAVSMVTRKAHYYTIYVGGVHVLICVVARVMHGPRPYEEHMNVHVEAASPRTKAGSTFDFYLHPTEEAHVRDAMLAFRNSQGWKLKQPPKRSE